MSEQQVFDYPAMLNRLIGDEKLAAIIISAFLKDLPAQLDSLDHLLRKRKAAAAGIQAHKIKGAAASASTDALRETAAEMEKAGKTGDLAALNRLMPRLRDRYNEAKRAMKEKIDESTDCRR